jgi:serine/threonine protein kinase/Tol biopolymer transport system component
MGEVYRARDTRLERDVAIKVLPSALSSDPSLRQRLEREAKAVSKLSHPNICTLHDIGHDNGIDFLVMELIEGETLEHRLAKGALPIEQTLLYSTQIAGALAKAHKLGITHRDLKPGNIMLAKSGAKLMDFGLAKQSGPAPLTDALTEMTAAPSKLTGAGTLVGTFQYMAPEQLEGKEADPRTDIFALGEVLYEMATGKAAFSGASRASLIAAILTSTPPPIEQSQPLTPPGLERLVKACLAKDPDDRIQTAHDVEMQLRWIAESPAGAGFSSAESSSERSSSELSSSVAARAIQPGYGWLVSALLALLLLAGGAAWWFHANRPQPAMYFHSSVRLPANGVALSPDGRVLALVAYSEQTGRFMIWTQEIGGRAASVLPGTEDAAHPFWSPDGRSLGFFAQGRLKRVDVASGRSAQVLCDAPHGRGGTWNRDGVILFSPDGFAGLFRVSASGGAPVEVTHVDKSRFEFSHRWPVFLPDGKHFLYLAANFSGQLAKNEIYVGSLDAPEKRPVVNANSNSLYADPGYLLYARDNTLVAQRFDLATYTLQGEPFTLTDEVAYTPEIDLAVFSAAGHGTLVTQTGQSAEASQLTWFDRNGKPTSTLGPPSYVNNLSISPDGRSVAVGQIDRDRRHVNIWVYEPGRDAATRMTFSLAQDQLPSWSADGRRVLFSSNEKLHFTLHQKNADGSGPEEEVADLDPGGMEQAAWSSSRDAKYLLAMKDNQLWYLTTADWHARPYLQPKGIVRNGQFSPDGKWVAYASNETGSWEVYVVPFPNPDGKWQVSRTGGEEPRWRHDGKELFFLSSDRKMMAAAIKTSGGFESGAPVALFQTHLRQVVSFMDAFSYDVAPDGQRFLLNARVDEANAAPLSVVLNWTSEIEK